MVNSTKKPNITDRLEAEGWLVVPTAKVQYQSNPNLRFKYPTYDDYIEENYRRNKNKWIFGGVSSTTESKTSIEVDSLAERTEIVIDETQAVEVEELIKKNSDNYIPNVPESLPVEEKEGFEVKHLKSKKKRALGNTRQVNTNCPYCLSKLENDEFGILQCTGDKLKIWEKEFIKYEKLDGPKKIEYLKNYTDSGIFLELYERWSFLDERGMKQPLVCVYSNKLFNPISRFRTTMPDPALVMTIEASLGRPLTEEEKYGEVELFREGKRYFTDYKKGRIKVKIPLLIYPDNFL